MALDQEKMDQEKIQTRQKPLQQWCQNRRPHQSKKRIPMIHFQLDKTTNSLKS